MKYKLRSYIVRETEIKNVNLCLEEKGVEHWHILVALN